MKTFLLALLFVLAACNPNNPPPPPQPPSHPVQVSMAPSAWSLQYSPGAGPIAQSAQGWSLAFPASTSACPDNGALTCPSVHYVVAASPLLSSKMSMTWTGTVTQSADAQYNYNIAGNNPTGAPANCRPFIEEANDNQTNEYFRWWSNPATVELKSGAFSITVNFDPALWSDVNGHLGTSDAAATAGFNQALANVQWIGFTCGGGSFFGHGVNMSAGTAVLNVTNFMVQ